MRCVLASWGQSLPLRRCCCGCVNEHLLIMQHRYLPWSIQQRPARRLVALERRRRLVLLIISRRQRWQCWNFEDRMTRLVGRIRQLLRLRQWFKRFLQPIVVSGRAFCEHARLVLKLDLSLTIFRRLWSVVSNLYQRGCWPSWWIHCLFFCLSLFIWRDCILPQRTLILFALSSLHPPSRRTAKISPTHSAYSFHSDRCMNARFFRLSTD